MAAAAAMPAHCRVITMTKGDLLTRAISPSIRSSGFPGGSLAQDPVANAGDAEDVGLIPYG